MSETYKNGYSALEVNTKNAVMEVYHGETIEAKNKPHTEAYYKNTTFLQKIIIRTFLTLPVSQ